MMDLDLPQAILLMHWANSFALMLATAVAIESYRQTRLRALLLLSSGLSVLLISWFSGQLFSEAYRLLPSSLLSTNRPWLRIGEVVISFNQLLNLIGAILLAAGSVMLGWWYSRVRPGA